MLRLYNYALLISSLFISFSGNAQRNNGTVKPNWIVNSPFEQKVFIENNGGQFDGKNGNEADKVLFATRVNGTDIYFTSTGVTYCHNKVIRQTKGEEKAGNDSEKPPESTPEFFSLKWQDASKNVQLIPSEMVSYYYTYPGSNGKTSIAHAYKKLLYHNIYPNIDIEYSFNEEGKGLEYAIIVHPYADLSEVKEVYMDAENIGEDSKGDIIMQSTFGQFTEHAPAKTYYMGDNDVLTGRFMLHDNTVVFDAGNYDHSKTLVIDPWITNPNFAYCDNVYDVDYDNQGNAYGYGNYFPYQLIKINSSGVIQWIATTFTDSYGLNYYGDFTVNKSSGACYVCEGDQSPTLGIIKLNTQGIRVDSISVSSMNELWRIKYDACLGKIIVGGGGTDTIVQTCILDTGFTKYTLGNTLGAITAQHDVCFMALDKYNSNYCYFAVAKRLAQNDTTFDNDLIKCPLPSLTPASFIVPDGYTYLERNIYYIPQDYASANGANGLAVSPDWLYLYDGATLKRFDKNSGYLAAQKNISLFPQYWSGIDVDICNDIYVADNDTIEILDSTLNNAGDIYAPDTIFDLHLVSNTILAGGAGFIASYPAMSPSIGVSINRTPATSCTNCDGTATVKIKACAMDTNLYSYSWSNGQTNCEVTGLCAGNYKVTVSVGCEAIYTDTVNINALPTGGVSFTANKKNESCYGDNDASAIINPTGGSPPYTYLWMPSNNTSGSVTHLSVGTYTVRVSDSAGCAEATITISQPTPLQIDTNLITDISCYGVNDGSISINAYGGTPAYTYSWVPRGAKTNFINQLGQGVYTVTITDSNGCKATDTIPITQPSPLNINVTPLMYVYLGQSVTLTGSVTDGTPPYTYTWNSLYNEPTFTVSPTDTTTYRLEVTDANGCEGYAEIAVDVLPPCTIFVPDAFSPNGDGQNDVLYVRGSTCIKWMDFVIYDRWGNKVFESQDLNDGWDGRYRGQPMNTGTYVYYIKALTLFNKYISKEGSISLVR